MTNLSGDGCGRLLIFILHSHHNRHTEIVVLISQWQEDGSGLICIRAAQMFALNMKGTICYQLLIIWPHAGC